MADLIQPKARGGCWNRNVNEEKLTCVDSHRRVCAQRELGCASPSWIRCWQGLEQDVNANRRRCEEKEMEREESKAKEKEKKEKMGLAENEGGMRTSKEIEPQDLDGKELSSRPEMCLLSLLPARLHKQRFPAETEPISGEGAMLHWTVLAPWRGASNKAAAIWGTRLVSSRSACCGSGLSGLGHPGRWATKCVRTAIW